VDARILWQVMKKRWMFGTRSEEGRRRLAKSLGECQPSCDTRVFRMGNPASVMWCHPR